MIKDLLPRSLFGRSLLILVLPILFIQLVTVGFFVDRHWEKVTGRLSHAVAGEIAVVAAAIEDEDDEESGVDDDMREVFANIERHLYLKISYVAGAEIADGVGHAHLALFEGLFVRTLEGKLRERLERPFVVDANFADKLITIDVQLADGVLKIMLPERRLFSSSGYVFLLWVFGSSILLLMISVVFMRNQIRPIRKLAAAAKRFGQGRDVPEFKPSGAREVRAASQAFMDMHRRIKRQMEQRTMMLAGVSHDLRTPLTRMKLQLSMMEGADVEAMRGDVAAMEAMVNGYLDFVRGDGEEQTKITDVSGLIRELAEKMDHVSLDIQEDMQAMIRPLSFARCLVNVVENGLKFGQEVWISASVDDARKLNVIIEDDGPGLVGGQYEDVFKPFYRVDESRNADSGGVGLGLSIVKDVVNAHGGRIWMEPSEARGGLKVCIRIPV